MLERVYERVISVVLDWPKSTILATGAICFLCFASVGSVSKTFLPDQDEGEFSVILELPQGTNLDRTDKVPKIFTKLLLPFQKLKQLH